jgi:hypothetical protein
MMAGFISVKWQQRNIARCSYDMAYRFQLQLFPCHKDIHFYIVNIGLHVQESWWIIHCYFITPFAGYGPEPLSKNTSSYIQRFTDERDGENSYHGLLDCSTMQSNILW